MNIDQLKYFIEIANSGNLSKASKNLNISQPALSKYLSNLEDFSKTKFFISEKRKMKLTPAGKLYYDMATRILNVQNQTSNTIDLILNRSISTIRVGASPHRGSQLVGKVFSKFNQIHLNVNIELKECYQNDGLKMLLNDELDLLLGTTDSLHNDYINKLIMYSEEIVLAVPIYHPLANKAKYENGNLTPINPSLFINDPWVSIEKGSTLFKITQQIFNEYKISPSIVFSNKNINVVNAVLKEGGGVGFTLRSYADLNQRDTVYFSLDSKKYMYISAYYNKNRVLTDAEKYLVALLMYADKDTESLNPTRNKEAHEIYKNFTESIIL